MARFLVQTSWTVEVSSDWIAEQNLTGEQVQIWLAENVKTNLCPDAAERELKEFRVSVLPLAIPQEALDG